MIAAWKRQAIDGMASRFSGTGDAAKAASANEVSAPLMPLLEKWSRPY